MIEAKIILGALAVIWLAFVALEIFLWDCRHRAREWKAWRADVAHHLKRDGLAPFHPSEPWYVRFADRHPTLLLGRLR